jgi:signal transduction histidine kinase
MMGFVLIIACSSQQKKAEPKGLGLTIVQKILNRLGGKVWMESEKGKGSKFYVSLSAK